MRKGVVRRREGRVLGEAERLFDLLCDLPVHRRDIGLRERTLVEQRFDAKKTSDRMLQLLGEISGKRAGA